MTSRIQMDDTRSEVSTDEIRETNFLFQEMREKIPVDREDSIPTPSLQEETLAPPATPATLETQDNVQTLFDEIDYDNIELKKTLRETFDLMEMEHYFEDLENKLKNTKLENKQSDLFMTQFNDTVKKHVNVIVDILDHQMTCNLESWIGIGGPKLELSCNLVNLPPLPATRDLRIGIIQLSEREMFYSYGENIKGFHEFYSHLVHDQKYVLDRVQYPNLDEDSEVHPFYHKRSFCNIKCGEIPPERIELIVEDFPSAPVIKNIDGRDLVDFERKQRFPVFIVIDESDDDKRHNYRVLYSFEWMLLSRWHRDIEKCKVTEIHRSGIITGSKPDLGQFGKNVFNNPVCNQWQIFYTLKTENNKITVYHYSNMDESEINHFKDYVVPKLQARYRSIEPIEVKEMPDNDYDTFHQKWKVF